MSEYKNINQRVQRMAMDGLDISSIQDDAAKADLAREFLATRRFYAKAAIIITLVICITLTLGFLIFGNQVDSETIDSCKSACQSSGTMMDEVTPYRCVCVETNQE